MHIRKLTLFQVFPKILIQIRISFFKRKSKSSFTFPTKLKCLSSVSLPHRQSQISISLVRMPRNLLSRSTMKCFALKIVNTVLIVLAKGQAKEFNALRSGGGKPVLTCTYYIKCNETNVSIIIPEIICIEMRMYKSTIIGLMLCIKSRIRFWMQHV